MVARPQYRVVGSTQGPCSSPEFALPEELPSLRRTGSLGAAHGCTVERFAESIWQLEHGVLFHCRWAVAVRREALRRTLEERCYVLIERTIIKAHLYAPGALNGGAPAEEALARFRGRLSFRGFIARGACQVASLSGRRP